MTKTQVENENKILPVAWLITGISVGLAVAYFMDPDRGRRRRALVRDQAVHLNKVTNRLVEQKSHHIQNIMQGYWARVNFKRSLMGPRKFSHEEVH